MEKSYVSLDTKVCPICTKKHEVGVIFDTRMKDTLERQTLTGYELCPECKVHAENDFVAFVGCDPEKSDYKNGKLKMEDAYRTGNIAWVKRRVALQITQTETLPVMVLCENEVIFNLKAMME